MDLWCASVNLETRRMGESETTSMFVPLLPGRPLTSEASSSPVHRTLWSYVSTYWHWPVLIGASIYLYLQLFPPVDLDPPGDPVPDFEVQALSGEWFRMAEQRGDVVVVNVWATWCPPCRVEMPGFVDLQGEMRDEDVQFVGISVDRGDRQLVRDFATEYAVNFPTLHHPQIAARYFPGNSVPRTYVIDREGRVRFQHTGIIMKPSLRTAIETVLSE